jgi:hypothetical protein
MSGTFVERILFIACACASANIVTASGIVLYDAATSSQLLVVSAPSALTLSAPRLNDLGEIVWSQQLTMIPTTVGIFSNVRGQIASGRVSDADINNEAK